MKTILMGIAPQLPCHDGRPFTGSARVLLITTQARPTPLTRGQTLRIMIPRPGSWRRDLPDLFSGAGPQRLPRCRSPGRERTRMAGFNYQGAMNDFSRSLYSRRERAKSFTRSKNFLIFFAAAASADSAPWGKAPAFSQSPGSYSRRASERQPPAFWGLWQ